VAERDPWRTLDAQPNVRAMIAGLEARGGTAAQKRLRHRFLRFVPVRPGQRVLEIGCGTGVVLRDLAPMVGRRGSVIGVDASRTVLAAARRLCRSSPGITLRHADGARLPFAAESFDVALAITVILHVADPRAVVEAMVRATKRGGRVGVQDQDFGMLGVTHPDRELTDHILGGVVRHLYEEPYSGRRLPGLLRAAGLERVRVLTDFFQDTTLEPWTKTFLERRAEYAVRFGLVDEATAQKWLDGFTAMVAEGSFVFTMTYYGAVGVKPRAKAAG
jgi:ubiquinone/menaquinone biosynthesis C-methylase UbiE